MQQQKSRWVNDQTLSKGKALQVPDKVNSDETFDIEGSEESSLLQDEGRLLKYA